MPSSRESWLEEQRLQGDGLNASVADALSGSAAQLRSEIRWASRGDDLNRSGVRASGSASDDDHRTEADLDYSTHDPARKGNWVNSGRDDPELVSHALAMVRAEDASERRAGLADGLIGDEGARVLARSLADL